ncbi:hypothetical protein ACFL6C_02165 [Myxococcota bacterium]
MSWVYHQVSSYAAGAPLGDWITAGVLLSATGMVVVALLLSWAGPFRENAVAHLGALLFGGSAAGLVVLAWFEETAPNLAALKGAGFLAIRQQSFHDAGLLVFFLCALGALSLVGGLLVVKGPGRVVRLMGAATALCGPLAIASLRLPWPEYMGIASPAMGLRQRVAFVALAIGAAFVVVTVSKRSPRAFENEDQPTRPNPRISV